MRIIAKSIFIGLIFSMGGKIYAQSAPEEKKNATPTNEQLLETWKRETGQTPPAVEKKNEEARLESTGNLILDGYHRQISAQDPLLSPFKPGTFGRIALTSDFKLIQPAGDITAFQAAFVGSNDRSIVARYPNQIINVQAGQTGASFGINTGDYAVNYSQLGVSTGLRGIALTSKIENWTVSGLAGIISESWEALVNRSTLDNSFARTRYLRNIAGAKVEREFSPALKFYVAAQRFSDRENSLSEELRYQLPAASRGVSTGFKWQEQSFTLDGEVASSHYSEKDGSKRNGMAGLLDGTYRTEKWVWRAGYHDIDAGYISLAQAVPPGIREHYIGTDWNPANWFTAGVDYRHSSSRTLQFIPSDGPLLPGSPLPPPNFIVVLASKADTVSGRANINFNERVPGLMLSMAASTTNSENAQGFGSRNTNLSSTLNFSSANWNANTTISGGTVENVLTPQYDSRNRGVQFAFGRNHSQTDIAGAPLWNMSWNIALAEQRQQLVNDGTETRARSISFSLTGQRTGLGQFNFFLARSANTQPGTGQEFVTYTYQLEASRPISGQNEIKLYFRGARRNTNVPEAKVDERAGGLQFTFLW